MHFNPLKIFLLWMGETCVSIMVSLHFNFNLVEFRVWSLWVMSMLLGMIQLFHHKEFILANTKKWGQQIWKGIMEFLGR